MRAGDRHALLEPHEFREHFRPPHDGNAPRARRGDLRIVALDGRRDDDHRGCAEIGLVVADMNRRALLAQALDAGVFGEVRALNFMAEVDEHFGDARHADAADADEVDGADLARQLHGSAFSRWAGELARAHEGDEIGQFARFWKSGGAPDGAKSLKDDPCCAILVSMTRIVKSSSPAKPRKPRRTRDLRTGRWPLQDAKARFSELVRRVRSEGPQHVTVHGRDEVVVIAAEEFRRLKGDLTGEALIAAMQASPHREIDIEPKRAPMPVRGVAL